ncbi:protein lingerer-like isoform X2 [Dysidea avara]|uniref:protein lingerer-like isoform X2 n=1 Tax=Dysidea avara TaxID=196820 RepID=UPI00331A7FC4
MSRTTSYSQRSKQLPPTAKQASEEQLHIASRIGESHTIPADIKDKIQQVASIVLDKTEDEICITLHDNNFDPEATISALLDSDNFKSEWTTKKSKSKKKANQPTSDASVISGADAIVAPGDSRTSSNRDGPRSFGGTSRAAAKTTREGYGGGVSVERGSREQRGGKGYGRNMSRGFRGTGERGRLRRRRGGGSGSRGFPSRDQERGRNSGSDGTSNRLPSPQSNVPSTEDTWDDDATFPTGQNNNSLLPGGGEADWSQDNHPTSTAGGVPSQMSSGQVSSVPSLSVFPDAIVPPLATEGEEASTSPSLVNTSLPPSQQQTAVLDNRLLQQMMEQKVSSSAVSMPSQLRVKFSDDLPTSQSPSQKLKSGKGRRPLRSEIPSAPVQMPRAMGSLEAEFGNLGIDFIGMNGGGGSEADDVLKTISQSQQIPQQQQQQVVDNTMPVSSFPQHLGQLTTSSVDQLHTVTSSTPLLSSSEVSTATPVYTTQQHFVDDPSIISITSSAIIGTTSSRTSYHREEPRIEPPPGLTHPSKLQQQVNKDAVAKASSGLLASMPLSAQQPDTRTSSSYGVASEHTTTTAVVLSQQDNLLSTMATHQSPLGAVVGGHKRNSSLQAEHHEVLTTTESTSSVLPGRPHDISAHPPDHPMLGKTASGPPAVDISRAGSGDLPITSSLPASSRIEPLPSSRAQPSTQMEMPKSRIEPHSSTVSQSVFSDKGMGQVSNGLLMTPMTTMSATNAAISSAAMGHSMMGGASRPSSSSHGGPQNKHPVPPGMMYPAAAAMMPQYPILAYFPTSTDSLMATGMMRDHTASNYPPTDAKYGREISSPVGGTQAQQPQAQQQGLQQGQGVHPFMNAAAIPYGNMFYANSAMMPSLYPTLGLPGFSPSMGPKPAAAGGSYPTGTVSTYQPMAAAGAFNMSGGYEELNTAVNHDYGKSYMNPQPGKLPVGVNSAASTNSEIGGSSFKHQPPFDTTKNYGYNMPMGGSGGYMGGFFPTMMHPAQMPSLMPTPADVNQPPRQPVQKQHKGYGTNVFGTTSFS